MALDIRIRKETAVPPKVIDPPKRGYRQHVSCRRCGYGIYEAGWRYCPNCGQRVAHFSYAGGAWMDSPEFRTGIPDRNRWP